MEVSLVGKTVVMKTIKQIPAIGALGAAALLLAQTCSSAEAPADNDLAQQIFETMVKVHGVTPGHRLVHAKGLVCEGTFTPSADAPSLSKAAHFQKTVPVTIRYSDGSPDPAI